MMKATIAIVTVDRPDFIVSTILDALGQDYECFEVVVVDQTESYPPDVDLVLSKLMSRITYIRTPVKGLCRARNMAVRAAQGEIIWFIDDDVELPPSALRAHVACHSRYASVGGVYGAVKWPVTDTRHASGDQNLFYLEPGEPVDEVGRRSVKWVIGANMSFKTSVLMDAGEFDETIRQFCDDIDMSLMVRGLGYALYFDPKAEIVHYAAVRGGCANRDPRLLHRTAENYSCDLSYVLAKNSLTNGLRPLTQHVYGGLRSQFLNRRALCRPWTVFGKVGSYLLPTLAGVSRGLRHALSKKRTVGSD